MGRQILGIILENKVFLKLKLSKTSVKNPVLLKQKDSGENSMILVYKSLSKYVVKWVGCNRRCTFSISDFFDVLETF